MCLRVPSAYVVLAKKLPENHLNSYHADKQISAACRYTHFPFNNQQNKKRKEADFRVPIYFYMVGMYETKHDLIEKFHFVT
jgi:hypothetical protein